MNYQQELDGLIREMAPSPLTEQHVDWLRENIGILNRRLERLMNVKRHLMRKSILTKKERRILSRYRGKVNRISALVQHREHLMFIAKLRIKQSGAAESRRQRVS